MKRLYFHSLPRELLSLVAHYMAYESSTDRCRFLTVIGEKKAAGKEGVCIKCGKLSKHMRLPLRWRQRYAGEFNPRGATPLCFDCYYAAHSHAMETDHRSPASRYLGVAHPGPEKGTIVYMFEDRPAINLLSTSESSTCMTIEYDKYCIDVIKRPSK